MLRAKLLEVFIRIAIPYLMAKALDLIVNGYRARHRASKDREPP